MIYALRNHFTASDMISFRRKRHVIPLLLRVMLLLVFQCGKLQAYESAITKYERQYYNHGILQIHRRMELSYSSDPKFHPQEQRDITIVTAPVQAMRPDLDKNDGEVIFEEEFDSENRGWGNLHYRGFKNWLVTRGEVDLVGGGFRYYDPEKNLYVDLSGTDFREQGSIAGTLQSKEMFDLEPGTYVLQFDLACKPQPINGEVHVQLADVYDEILPMDSPASGGQSKLHRRTIQVFTQTMGRLVFEYRGQYWGDVLLDNIRLIKVLGEQGGWRIKGVSDSGVPANRAQAGKLAPEGIADLIRQSQGSQQQAEAISVDAVEPAMSLSQVLARLDHICKMALETQDALLQTMPSRKGVFVDSGAEKNLER